MLRLRYYVGPDWPLDRARYAYVLNLCNSDLAWEFLRRNPEYQRDYRLFRRGADRPRRLGSGQFLTRLRRRSPRCERWGLDPLVDPACPAPTAPLCWTIGEAAPVLDGIAVRATGQAPAALSIKGYDAARHILIGPTGEEYVLLRDAERAATLRLEGSRASLGAVNVTFLVRDLPDPYLLAQRFRTLRRLIDAPRQEVRPSRTRLFYRDALIALDARLVGLSHREIAVLLHGTGAVRSSWSCSSGSIRERVRNLLARGQALRDGAYRKLLG
ncbi:MAG TPA: DUF2285 domain-containing protein [Hyphomicrobiaceae bacterium]|nr:DUF2285 domain-containing protein [Hyphomicrobiaceae bacterium]